MATVRRNYGDTPPGLRAPRETGAGLPVVHSPVAVVPLPESILVRPAGSSSLPLPRPAETMSPLHPTTLS